NAGSGIDVAVMDDFIYGEPQAVQVSDPKTYVATLTGAQEVPPRTTDGRGTCVVILAPDETTGKAGIIFSRLSTPSNGAHIHGPADPGVNAPIIFPFTVPAATSGSASNLTITPTAQQLLELKTGKDYANVHSTQFPGGEIRGQILFNPIDEASIFVRQHYLDFLNRAPDAGGLGYWTNEITKCGADAGCISSRRIGVSAAFFIEQEFQQTGFFVYRLRRAALGTQPSYAQYLVDRSQLASSSEPDKTAYALAFVQRGEFVAKYPTTQTGSEFIDALIATVKANSGVDLAVRRPDLANEYIQSNTLVESRTRVLRKLVEYPEFVQAETNPAFVLAEYFGYLRRDPDPGGYAFWLNVLNNKEPNNFRGMVCSFITSQEYQERFGSTATRANIECADASTTATQDDQ
ncbi:MAG TPA: CHRD domain-containing protein, partial [Pyrinomonadaceae bacterium]